MQEKICRTITNQCNFRYNINWRQFINEYKGTKVLFIDSNIDKLYSFDKDAFELIFVTPQSDAAKKLSYYESVVEEMGNNKIDSHVTIFSLGGGSVSNLAGFVAGTYKRGVKFVTIPTTLLAMVDACISFKQAINTACGKNQIGLYKVPEYIIVCTEFLKTLEERFVSDGYAEIIKHFVCEGDTSFSGTIDDHIIKTILMKIEHIRKDPWELHPILMYGHQYAHAIEYLSNDEYFHGESVNVGMIGTSMVGNLLGIHDDNIIVKHKLLSDKYNLPKTFSTYGKYTLNDVLNFMHNDKSVKDKMVCLSFGDVLINECRKINYETLVYGLNSICIDKYMFYKDSEMSKIAYGTHEVSENNVYEAIKSGFRTIDCAHYYGNQKAIGKAIKRCIIEGICSRKDLYIISKLWNDQHDDVMGAIDNTLNDLGLDYLDMFLMHWPIKYDNFEQAVGKKTNIRDVFSTMKNIPNAKCKNVGVSNFSVNDLEKIIDLEPRMNQIEYHPYNQETELCNYCDNNNILVMAYSPLSKVAVESEFVTTMKRKYECSAQQFILRWILQNKRAFAVKTTQHYKDNLKLDFEISEDDIVFDNSKNIRTIEYRAYE